MSAPNVPEMHDLSLEGRKEFVAEHFSVLWDFWSGEFAMLVVDGTIDPTKALGRRFDGGPTVAGEEIAELLLDRLRERLTLEFAHSWSNVEVWWVWLIGKQAARAGRTLNLPTSTGNDEIERQPDLDSPPPDEALERAQEKARLRSSVDDLVRRGSRLLSAVVTTTGVQQIEVDWLIATEDARLRLRKAVCELWEALPPNADSLIDTPDDLVSWRPKNERDGAKRTRLNAAACFRFNLAHFVEEAGNEELTSAAAVFLAPTKDVPPFRPRGRFVDDSPVVSGFVRVLALTSNAHGGATSVVERLWSGLLDGAIHKAVTRLLPRRLADRLEADWEHLVSGEEEASP